MTESVSYILSQVERLSDDERAEIALAVISSLGPIDEQHASDWEAELDRRVDEIQSGKALGRPAEEVFARLAARRS